MKASRRARLRAIARAAEPGLFVASSRADGLRAVLLFERVNGIALDPRNNLHMRTITNTGWHFALERRLKASQTPVASVGGSETRAPARRTTEPKFHFQDAPAEAA